MAAMIRHGVFKTGQLTSTKNVVCRCFATKAEKRKGIDRKVVPKIDSTAQSLAAKGFLRSQKEYAPPIDLHDELKRIFKSIVGQTNKDTKITKAVRFKLFIECEQVFDHSIPNSLLHTIETLGDLTKFYETKIDLRTPLDKMRNMDLPENLHVQYEYHRFHPESDTMFGGVTAFNESSTLVTGLKSREKYKGHIQQQNVPRI